MSVGDEDSPGPAVASPVPAAGDGSDADAPGAPDAAAGSVEAAARGQCLVHSFGEAKLLRQRSRPSV